MNTNKLIVNIKRTVKAMRLLSIYISAKLILVRHYDKSLFLNGKWFAPESHGRFTSPGWALIVNDYRSCKKNEDKPFRKMAGFTEDYRCCSGKYSFPSR